MKRRQAWYPTRLHRVARGVWILLALGFAGIFGSLGATIASAAPTHARPHISGRSYLHRWSVVPPRGDVQRPPAASVLGASSALDLSYQGGIGGVGVTTAPPKVYLVFYGSQWGTQSTTSLGGNAYASFSGDPAAMAPDLQAFFAGLGTNNDQWSGVMTQYCQSTATVTVAIGATSCPAGAAHVGYPSGGALAGVWEDASAPAPAAATQAQLASRSRSRRGALWQPDQCREPQRPVLHRLADRNRSRWVHRGRRRPVLRLAYLHRRHERQRRVHQPALPARRRVQLRGQASSMPPAPWTGSRWSVGTSTPRRSPTSSRSAAGTTPPTAKPPIFAPGTRMVAPPPTSCSQRGPSRSSRSGPTTAAPA